MFINWIRRLWEKKEKPQKSSVRNPCTSFERNKIYPNDECATVRLNQWLDDVFEKHHGW